MGLKQSTVVYLEGDKWMNNLVWDQFGVDLNVVRNIKHDTLKRLSFME